jgi:hypothetical protein
MATTRPSRLLEFATTSTFTAPGKAWNAQPTKVAFDNTSLSQGVAPGDKLPAQYFNDRENLTGQWVNALVDKGMHSPQMLVNVPLSDTGVVIPVARASGLTDHELLTVCKKGSVGWCVKRRGFLPVQAASASSTGLPTSGAPVSACVGYSSSTVQKIYVYWSNGNVYSSTNGTGFTLGNTFGTPVTRQGQRLMCAGKQSGAADLFMVNGDLTQVRNDTANTTVFSSAKKLIGIACNNDCSKIVAIGLDGIAAVYTGGSWSDRATPADFVNIFYAHDNATFYASTDLGDIYSSTDAVTWTARGNSGPGATIGVTGIAADGKGTIYVLSEINSLKKLTYSIGNAWGSVHLGNPSETTWWGIDYDQRYGLLLGGENLAGEDAQVWLFQPFVNS